MEKVNKEQFEKIIQEEKIVLADFFADWCGPCKMMIPVLEQFSKEKNDNVKVVKINVDEEESLAWQFGIQSIPTLIFFVDGKPVRKEIGYRTIAQLNTILEKGL